MITRIEAYNYRCFDKLDVALGEYAVMVGANGAGKSTLLDIVPLLGSVLQAEYCSSAFLEKVSGKHGVRAKGLNELVYRGDGEWFSFAVEATLPQEQQDNLLLRLPGEITNYPERYPTHLRYEVEFVIFNDLELQISREYLSIFPGQHAPTHGAFLNAGKKFKYNTFLLKREAGGLCNFHREAWQGRKKPSPVQLPVRPHQSALGVAPYDPENFTILQWFSRMLQAKIVLFNPNWLTLKTAATPGKPMTLQHDGSNIPWLALELKENDPELFGFWVEHVQTAIPAIREIDVLKQPVDNAAFFQVTYEGGYTVTSSGLSDGTLSILAYTLLAYIVQKPAMLLIEEPENGIYPVGIETVMQSLRSVYDSQILISTHSPMVLASTDLDKILCFRMEDKDGLGRVVRGCEHPYLQNYKGAIDKSTLFAAGVFG
jgi:predicted ATPase